jgi:hypothetical protein
MRPAVVILLLVATATLFQSRNWGWDLPQSGLRSRVAFPRFDSPRARMV